MWSINWKPVLDRLPEPLYTVAYFVLKIDLVISSLIFYLSANIVFWMPPKGSHLALAVVFGYLPYLDYLPYHLLKKRRHYISHFLWYKPLVYLPVGALLVFVVATLAGAAVNYLVALFIATSAGHFLMSAAGAPQGISLYPFNSHFALRRVKWKWIPFYKPAIVSQPEHDRILAQAAQNIRKVYGIKEPWDRTWHQELDSRSSRTSILSLIVLADVVHMLVSK